MMTVVVVGAGFAVLFLLTIIYDTVSDLRAERERKNSWSKQYWCKVDELDDPRRILLSEENAKWLSERPFVRPGSNVAEWRANQIFDNMRQELEDLRREAAADAEALDHAERVERLKGRTREIRAQARKAKARRGAK